MSTLELELLIAEGTCPREVLFGRSFTFDWIALFWIGAAVLSIVCALTVWKARAEQ